MTPLGRQKELQRLRGIGGVLAERLVAAGLDDFDKIVAAGATGLVRIRGLQFRAIPSILAQAADLATAGKAQRRRRIGELKQAARIVRMRLGNGLSNFRERFPEEFASPGGLKLEGELLRLLSLLLRVEQKLDRRVKRAEKGVRHAERLADEMAEAPFEAASARANKSRKALQRVFA